jgi:hypothetical protein
VVVTGRRGASRIGCLLTLLLLAVGSYYAVNLGGVYWRYYQMKDAMQAEARLAPSIGDDVIQRRLRAKAEELGLPPQAQRFRIRRRTRPREITIGTEWQEVLELPFVQRTVTLRPEVRAQL